MFFTIIFLISLTGLLIIFIILKKRTSKELLHYIKKSCNIDSIRFEKKVLFIVFYLKKLTLRIYSKIKRIVLLFFTYVRSLLSKTRAIIRKKLFSQKEHNKISEFISQLK